MAYPNRGTWAFTNVTRSFAFWPTLDSIDISQAQPEDIATFSCRVVDEAASLTFEPEDQVRVTFDGVKVFAGHIKVIEESYLSEAGPRVYGMEAQDYTAKLDDSVIDDQGERASESLSDRVTWILTFLNYAVTTTGVSLPAETAEAAEYDGMTVREALEQLAEQHRLHFYVDFDKDLHLFRTETTTAPFDLDDDAPDYSTSFPYTEYHRRRDSTDLATAAYVQGESGIAWVEDSGAIATWGRQERTVNDGELKTANAIVNAGARALAQDSQPAIEGDLVCWEPGIRAGMTASLTNDLWALSGVTIVITSVRISAVDPHGADGKAYLRTEVSFTDRRRGRASHRNATNKNTRKRLPTDSTEDAGTTAGSDTFTVWPTNSATYSWLSGTFAGPTFASPRILGSPRIGSLVTENTPYTTSGCPLGCGLWGPGGYTEEAWYPVTVPAGDYSAIEVTIPDFSGNAFGVAVTGMYWVGWSTEDGPDHLDDYVIFGIVPVTGGTVIIPASALVESSGGGATSADNWLVIGPVWRALVDWSACADALAFGCDGPYKGGEANSGRTDDPNYANITITALDTDGPGRTSWVAPFGSGIADGTNDTWTLDEWNGRGIPEARWGAIILSAATDYTYDAGAKTVTFREPPPEGTVVAFRYRVD